MARLALSALACLALASQAAADRFYLGPPPPAGEAGLATEHPYIEGVLLRAVDGVYVIRVEGGEIWLDRAAVYKIEEDDLTVAQIEQRERDAADRLAQANAARLERQQAMAAAREAERAVEEARAPRELRIAIDLEGLLPGYVFKVYDPVIHRAEVVDLAAVVYHYLRDQVENALHLHLVHDYLHQEPRE